VRKKDEKGKEEEREREKEREREEKKTRVYFHLLYDTFFKHIN